MVPKEQSDGVDRLCRVEKPVCTGWRRRGAGGSALSFHGSSPGMRVRPAPPGCSRAVGTRASFGADTP
eukprot:413658-Prymnesium_polylepis.1